MIRISLYSRYSLSLLAILWILSSTGCSMQNSKPMNDASNQKQSSTEARAMTKPDDDWTGFKQHVVRIDYLRPVASIKKPTVYVYKEKRRLYVLDGDVLVREYPIGLGSHSRGDKIKQGDGRTPEGTFFVCVKNGRSRFGKSLGVSYPTLNHAQRALFAGLITPDQYREIKVAFQHRQAPPWDTPLGGEIFFHGGGAQADWTDGCVALYNSDMQELFRLAKLGTPITIRP
jgi:murein L,D-transpeptidase YafK